MISNSVNEKMISFKELEKKIFKYVCELGCEITRSILETDDDAVAAQRDKQKYRNKGKRSTCIKTVYGPVEYQRRIYGTITENGEKAYVYLLDAEMRMDKIGMDKIGMVSSNLAEKIAMTVTEAPYRVTAETISSTSGQSISASGVWNVM